MVGIPLERDGMNVEVLRANFIGSPEKRKLHQDIFTQFLQFKTQLEL